MNITKLNKKRIITNIVILNIVLFLLFLCISFIFYHYDFDKTLSQIKENQKEEYSAVRRIVFRYFLKDKNLFYKYLGMYNNRSPYSVYIYEEGNKCVYPKNASNMFDSIMKKEVGFIIYQNQLIYKNTVSLQRGQKGETLDVQVVLADTSMKKIKFASLKKIIYKGVALYVVIAYILSMLLLIISRLNYDKFQTRIFGDLIKQTNDGVIITDALGKVIFANDSFLKMFNVKLKKLLGEELSKFNSFIHDEEFFKGMIGHLNREGSWESDVINSLENGDKLYTKLKITAIKNNKTKEKYFICMYQNKTDSKMQKIEILRLQLYDSYTGLPNRTYATKYLEKLISSKNEFAYININIDNFKEINDSYGFEIGDKLLLQFIEKIKEVFGSKTFIARVDGKKIAAVIELANINKLNEQLNDLIVTTKKPFKIFAETILVQAGISVLFYPEHQGNIDSMFKNECELLNRKIIDNLTSVIENKVKKKNEILEQIKVALKENEFSLFYQPRIDSSNRKIIGAEALIRWESKKLGNISPLYLIPLAEASGYIEEISKWTINVLCKQIAEWQKKSKLNFPISLNISPYYLKHEKFVERFINEISKNSIEKDNVQIEISEKGIKNNCETIKANINNLAKEGIAVLIDNFGTGNSKLEYLKQLDISMLKIDREFIKNYPASDDGSIAKVIIHTAQALNIGVVGEGVETEEQVEFLRSNGCNLIQGYYYSRPISEKDFELSLKKGKI